MATKEGAERACLNKRPVIDGRRANVDLAYIGAKPKIPKDVPQQDERVSPKCSSVPPSPTTSEHSFTENGTEWAVEEQSPKYSVSPSFPGNFAYDSVHPVQAHTVPSQAMIMSPVDLKPVNVSCMQTVSPNLPLMNTMDYYQRNVQSHSSAGCNSVSLGPNYLNHQRDVNLVTYLPSGHVGAPQESLALNAQFALSTPHPTKLIPSPRYVYTVPVWYVEQGGVSCAQVSLNPGSGYSQSHLIPAGVNGNTNCGIQAGKLYPMPITYY